MKLISLIIGPLMLIFAPRYDNIFSSSYQEAMTFLASNATVINQVLDEEKGEKETVVAVVFPELLRQSLLIDYFQERAMEIVYVNHGKERADFSIGDFQMKPSFIEKMEAYVNQNERVYREYVSLFDYSQQKEKKIRKARMERIKDLRWQLLYMKCFFVIMNDRFVYREYKNEADKIRFYAAAYNHDFLASEEDIEKWSKKQTFPYGVNSDKKQYSYSKISTYFYLKSWPDLEKDMIQKELRADR